MGKLKNVSVEERIVHSTYTLKYCEEGTEAVAEGWAELHVTIGYSQETKGGTETHLNQAQTKVLEMTNIPAKPFVLVWVLSL